MGPTIQNITLERGDDEDLIIWFFQDDVDETPVALSELVDVRLTIRTDWATTEADNSSAVYAASLLTSGISPSGDSSVMWSIPRALTQALAFQVKPLKYDVEILTAAGKTRTTQKGNLSLGVDVGRP